MVQSAVLDLPDDTLRDRSSQACRLLVLATEASAAAGDFLTNTAREDAEVWRKLSFADVASQADIGAERLIREFITRQRPGDGILGEELGLSTTQGHVNWLVDPVDGTTNFLARLPFWATSIAAVVDDVVEAAVVHAPALGVTFQAAKGVGVWRNGRRLTPPRPLNLQDAVVATGFSAIPHKRNEQSDTLRRLVPEVRDIRIHGAASLELCAVANGELGAYLETDLETWDIAAGTLIAREASCLVHERDDVTGGLLACNPSLYQPLRRCLLASHTVQPRPTTYAE